MRIALASSNGDAVDLHLGKAVSLAIYDVVDDKFDFVETRKVAIDKNAKHQGGDVIQKCSDCDVIISTQHGFMQVLNWFVIKVLLRRFYKDILITIIL